MPCCSTASKITETNVAVPPFPARAANGRYETLAASRNTSQIPAETRPPASVSRSRLAQKWAISALLSGAAAPQQANNQGGVRDGQRLVK
jgi:hypothetical protein